MSKDSSFIDAVFKEREVVGLPGAATANKGRYVPPAYVVVEEVGVNVKFVVAPTIH